MIAAKPAAPTVPESLTEPRTPATHSKMGFDALAGAGAGTTMTDPRLLEAADLTAVLADPAVHAEVEKELASSDNRRVYLVVATDQFAQANGEILRYLRSNNIASNSDRPMVLANSAQPNALREAVGEAGRGGRETPAATDEHARLRQGGSAGGGGGGADNSSDKQLKAAPLPTQTPDGANQAAPKFQVSQSPEAV